MPQFFDAYRGAPDLSTMVIELPWPANLLILSGAKRLELPCLAPHRKVQGMRAAVMCLFPTISPPSLLHGL
jgi:hypothetical protein